MPANRLDFLLCPTRTAAAFAVRTTAGALLALVLAVLLGLGNPYWSAMTVLVVSQPLRGQVMARGFYRLVGTLVGAAAGLLLLHALRSWPGVLVAALALWIGACAVAANLLRGFRAYGAVLAAVTGALVALLAFTAAILTRGVLLPAGTGPPLDVVVVGVFLVLGTLAMANHRTAIAGTEFSMMFMFMTEPGRAWTHPPEHLFTLGGGIVCGVAIATVVFALVLPVDPRRRLRALTREVVRDLEHLAAAKRLPAARRWRSRAYHRVLRLVVRASAADEEPEAAVEGGLAAIAVGTGLLRLHSLSADGSLPAPAVEAIGGALPTLRSLGEDPERAATAALDAANQLGEMPTADSPGAIAVARARLALLEVAEALGANPGFFRAVLPRRR